MVYSAHEQHGAQRQANGPHLDGHILQAVALKHIFSAYYQGVVMTLPKCS